MLCEFIFENLLIYICIYIFTNFVLSIEDRIFETALVILVKNKRLVFRISSKYFLKEARSIAKLTFLLLPQSADFWLFLACRLDSLYHEMHDIRLQTRRTVSEIDRICYRLSYFPEILSCAFSLFKYFLFYTP